MSQLNVLETYIPLDLGASWVHGTVGNPLAVVAKENNIDLQLDECGMELYDEDGKVHSLETKRSTREKYSALLQTITREVTDPILKSNGTKKDCSFATALEIAMKKGKNVKPDTKAEERIFNYRISGTIDIDWY